MENYMQRSDPGTKATKIAPASQPHRRKGEALGRLSLEILLIACATFFLALLDFATRLPRGLATLWPGCPMLLGSFILFPRLARPLCWAVVLLVLVANDYFVAQLPALSALTFNAIDVISMLAQILFT